MPGYPPAAPTPYQPNMPGAQQPLAPQQAAALKQQALANYKAAASDGSAAAGDFLKLSTLWDPPSEVEQERCPVCVSKGKPGDHYFTRTNSNGEFVAPRGPQPAPMCADCGFTGLFHQDADMPNARQEAG
jgi:hypothetical protein